MEYLKAFMKDMAAAIKRVAARLGELARALGRLVKANTRLHATLTVYDDWGDLLWISPESFNDTATTMTRRRL